MCFLGEPFKHDLFVSYSHGDFDGSGCSPLKEWSKSFVVDLERQLRQIRPFRDVRVFLDQDQRPDRGVDPTEPLTEQLKDDISAAALLIVLMTPHYLASAWCTQEREWWLDQNTSDQFGVGGRIFVCRVLPNFEGAPWRPEHDDKRWPDALKDSGGHALTGFWFHTTEDVHFDTVPFKWDGSTDDLNHYNRARQRLIRHLTIRLNEIRQQLEDWRKEEAYRRRLMEEGTKILYLHARERQLEAWHAIRDALTAAGYVVYPAAPEPDLIADVLPDFKAIRKARRKRILQLAECDAILLLCGGGGTELEIDLPAIGRNDRQSARDLTGKLLPCAVLDLVGQPIDTATALAIECLDARQPGWVMRLATWLTRRGRILETAA
jgi:hypothetical protein